MAKGPPERLTRPAQAPGEAGAGHRPAPEKGAAARDRGQHLQGRRAHPALATLGAGSAARKHREETARTDHG